MAGALSRIRRALEHPPPGEPGDISDRELLRRYARDGDEAAFGVLVRRYSRLVLGVCRHAGVSGSDAEDVCQAAFLVLSRKAKGGRWRHSIANWLYATARNLARNARTAASRRTTRERKAAVPEAVAPIDAMTGRELLNALAEELDRLPTIYREPLVLAFLDGLTRDEIAARLGTPAATVKTRLERGKKRLGDALMRRGVAGGFALLALAATSQVGHASSKLIASVLAASAGNPSAAAAALAQGVAVNGITKRALALVLTLGAVAAGFAALPVAAEPQKQGEKMSKAAGTPAANADRPKAAERTLTGTVLGADGKPVLAELFMVWVEDAPTAVGRTKTDGTFRVTVPLKVKERGGWLVARAGGHATDFTPTGMDYIKHTMTPTADVVLRLPKLRPIKGRVIDQQGKPVSGASVVASGLTAFDSDASADSHMKKWAEDLFLRGVPPDGDRGMWYSDGYPDGRNPDGRSPHAAKTDADGRFELDGFGTGQLVHLRVRGAGVADTDVVTLNRDGFDPAPINRTAQSHKYKEFGGRWWLSGPDPVVVAEPEKVIRGTVTGPDGKPRAGVRVTFSRTGQTSVGTPDLNGARNQAVTNATGKYEIRGAKKHKGYMVECPPDVVAGLLPRQAYAADTAGYEPVTIDLKCARGVVVKGTVRNKATGLPVVSHMYVNVLANNPFVEKCPLFLDAAGSFSDLYRTDAAGRFRVVTIPGPVLVMAAPDRDERGEFKPPVPDPKYPAHFHRERGHLLFDEYRGGRGYVQGNWCKVIDAKATDAEVTVDAELEPSTTTPVKVIDADGKPVVGCSATGITHSEFESPVEFPGTDTLSVANLEQGKERFLAVFHPTRKLLGTGTVKADDKNAVVKLGSGASVTGRVLDGNGKPVAGLTVHLAYDRREVAEAMREMVKSEGVTVAANGEFRFDHVFPGQEFRLFFVMGTKVYGPTFDKLPRYSVKEHGEVRKLGDLRLGEPRERGE